MIKLSHSGRTVTVCIISDSNENLQEITFESSCFFMPITQKGKLQVLNFNRDGEWASLPAEGGKFIPMQRSGNGEAHDTYSFQKDLLLRYLHVSVTLLL